MDGFTSLCCLALTACLSGSLHCIVAGVQQRFHSVMWDSGIHFGRVKASYWIHNDIWLNPPPLYCMFLSSWSVCMGMMVSFVAQFAQHKKQVAVQPATTWLLFAISLSSCDFCTSPIVLSLTLVHNPLIYLNIWKLQMWNWYWRYFKRKNPPLESKSNQILF